ncbi:MAG: hypothetical protein K6F73_03835 [Lachnospiraceae bacterium]|nr:hypothetical protein [Lachnospiraceae bacterium]
MNIQEANGKQIAKILEMIGPGDTQIRTKSEWVLSIYYSDRDDNTLTIEMCLSISLQGDPLFDPLMRIELALNDKEEIISARPIYYLSTSPFYTEEIYAKDNSSCYNPKLYEKTPGELDRRLNEWLGNLYIQGYLTEGVITKR